MKSCFLESIAESRPGNLLHTPAMIPSVIAYFGTGFEAFADNVEMLSFNASGPKPALASARMARRLTRKAVARVLAFGREPRSVSNAFVYVNKRFLPSNAHN